MGGIIGAGVPLRYTACLFARRTFGAKTYKLTTIMNTFDITRFVKLVRHDVRSCPMETLYSGLSLALTFAPLMMLSQQLLGQEQYGTFYRLALMVSMVTGWALMIPTQVYPNVGKKKRGIYFAMLPATKAEKHASIATLMVLTVVVLMAIGLTEDVLLTAVHLPGYTKYFWQSETLRFLDLPMVLGTLFTFLVALFGMIGANTVANNTLRGFLQVLLFLLMIGGLVVLPIALDNRPQAYWVVIAVEAAATLFLAWLSRHQMDRMTY